MSATVKPQFICNVDLSKPFRSKLMILNDMEGSENGLILHQAGADGPMIHTHLYQEECFTIMEGELEVYKDDTWNKLFAGQTIYIPANAPHSYRSRSTADCLFSYRITPKGGFTEIMMCFEKLSREGKIRTLKDLRSLIYLSMAFKKFGKEGKSVDPPDFVISLMAKLGNLLGYKL